MATGTWGTYVLAWAQTEVDGVPDPALDLVSVGATWRWAGRAARIDVPGDLLLLEGAEGAADLRRRAARVVRRLAGVSAARRPGPGMAAKQDTSPLRDEMPEDALEQGFVLTDGRATYRAVLLQVPDTGSRLVLFTGRVPPMDTDLWVVRVAMDVRALDRALPRPGGVICFTPGTMIATPHGPRAIETLREGDLIDTADNGPQPVMWTGARHLSGARLFAMPHLRPIRIRAGAVGSGRPDRALLVSPQHRMLVRGAAARALYNTDEVLIAAEHLVNDRTVTVDATLRDVTYIHVLLEAHQIVFANGLETESYHPGATTLDTLDDAQRAGLMAVVPGLAADAGAYGGFARRSLSRPEAAILLRAG